MDLLKILGLKGDSKSDSTTRAAQDNMPPAPEAKKPNPHAQGGCCGSCGGQKQH